MVLYFIPIQIKTSQCVQHCAHPQPIQRHLAHLPVLVEELVLALHFSDALAAAALRRLDHDREADAPGRLQSLLLAGHTAGLVQLGGDTQRAVAAVVLLIPLRL